MFIAGRPDHFLARACSSGGFTTSGRFVSGLLEAASLRLPLRKDVQVSEHAQ